MEGNWLSIQTLFWAVARLVCPKGTSVVRPPRLTPACARLAAGSVRSSGKRGATPSAGFVRAAACYPSPSRPRHQKDRCYIHLKKEPREIETSRVNGKLCRPLRLKVDTTRTSAVMAAGLYSSQISTWPKPSSARGGECFASEGLKIGF